MFRSSKLLLRRFTTEVDWKAWVEKELKERPTREEMMKINAKRSIATHETIREVSQNVCLAGMFIAWVYGIYH
jgi:hypothetical protein